jgi:hypothetical protein
VKPRAERDHRYNVSEKGRARYATYREAHRAEIRERDERGNSRRIFAGATYMGRATTPEQAMYISAHLTGLKAGFVARQREDYAAFTEQLNAARP